MNKSKLEKVARDAEKMTDRKPYTLSIEDIQRCLDGNRQTSHPVDYAIMELLRKLKK
jgi:hypothetical protein